MTPEHATTGPRTLTTGLMEWKQTRLGAKTLDYSVATVEHWTGNPDYCIGFAEKNAAWCAYLKVNFTFSAIYIITF